MFLFSPQILSETFFILSRTERYMIRNVNGSSCKVAYSLFLSDFNETWISQQICENIGISDFIKIRPGGAELFHESRQTDRYEEANSRFS
jgi:hypothetical protein